VDKSAAGLSNKQAIKETVESSLSELMNSVDSTLCVGLSAGVDSSVLLHALVVSVSAPDSLVVQPKIKAIHVHHGLSEYADAWAEQAETLCAQLSKHYNLTIECIIERVSLGHRSDGLEQAARQVRYQTFEKYCQDGDVLLQGHHLDDQIETFFMRAIRGSGLKGLSGIPKQRNLSRKNTCQIVRPFLTIEKAQLIEYAKEHRLNWVEDESNQDSKIDRNWWRNELLPQIWKRYPQQKYALSRTINTIQHEQNLLQQLIVDKLVVNTKLQKVDEKIHPALKVIPSFDLSLILGLDQAMALSYLRAWLAQYVDILPSAIQMQSIYVDMIQARLDGDPSFSWSLFSLYRYQNCLYLLDTVKVNGGDEPQRSDLLYWQGEEFNCFWGSLDCNELEAEFTLKPARYQIRHWQAGDVAKPSGRSTRKMKKWWQDYSVPSWARCHWPIIVNDETDEIACVPGLFVCQGYAVEAGELGWLCEYRVIK